MKLKWDVSGKGEEAWGASTNQYDGPVPPKGSYVARVKRITVGKIKAQGENQGKPRLSVLLEICGGSGSNGLDDTEYKYYGAPVWDGLNIIKSQAGRVNAFLHALTDGSPQQKAYVEDKFWPPNMDVNADKQTRRDGTEDIHIQRIGNIKIESPNGMKLVRIITKMGRDLEGNPRAEISQFLPYKGPSQAEAASTKNGQVEDGFIDDSTSDDDELNLSFVDASSDEPIILDDDEPPF